MSILKRLRDRLAAAGDALRDPADPATDRVRLSAEIPGAEGAPLWKIDVQLLSEPHGDGERVRLRAHLQTNFASALRPAIRGNSHKTGKRAIGHATGALTRAQKIGQFAQRAAARALATPVLRTVAEPLLRHDFNTWVEVHASTASLDRGAQDLVPAQEQLARLGIKPKNDGPIAESWAGEAPGGFAQVSLLQLDKKHLPPRLAKRFGDKPFSMAAAIVNVVEEK